MFNTYFKQRNLRSILTKPRIFNKNDCLVQEITRTERSHTSLRKKDLDQTLIVTVMVERNQSQSYNIKNGNKMKIRKTQKYKVYNIPV